MRKKLIFTIKWDKLLRESNQHLRRKRGAIKMQHILIQKWKKHLQLLEEYIFK